MQLESSYISLYHKEEFMAAGDDEPLEKYPDWQRESIVIAREVLEEDHYISLLTQYDIHEYNIMEKFCLSIDDGNLQDIMYSSIKGSGAFRRFKIIFTDIILRRIGTSIGTKQ